MEKFFKGLIERARYYEQFESFRYTHTSGKARDVQNLNVKKASSDSVGAEFLKVSP